MEMCCSLPRIHILFLAANNTPNSLWKLPLPLEGLLPPILNPTPVPGPSPTARGCLRLMSPMGSGKGTKTQVQMSHQENAHRDTIHSHQRGSSQKDSPEHVSATVWRNWNSQTLPVGTENGAATWGKSGHLLKRAGTRPKSSIP